MYVARQANPSALGDKPFIVLVSSRNADSAPSGVSEEAWKRLAEEKRQQKIGIAALSTNHELVFAQHSGYHIQPDEPELVVDAIQRVVESARNHTKQSGSNQ